MKIDLYMKFILTIIAACLLWHTFKSLLVPRDVQAYGETMNVNIEMVGGRFIVDRLLPVKVVR